MNVPHDPPFAVALGFRDPWIWRKLFRSYRRHVIWGRAVVLFESIYHATWRDRRRSVARETYKLLRTWHGGEAASHVKPARVPGGRGALTPDGLWMNPAEAYNETGLVRWVRS